MSELNRDTIVRIFWRRAAASDNRPVLFFPAVEGNQTRSWPEITAEIGRLASLLLAIGVRPGDRVAQISENRYEWIVADLAIQVARGIHVPMHAPLAGRQLLHQIQDASAKFVFISDAAQCAKLTAAAAELPADTVCLLHEQNPAATIGPHRPILWRAECQRCDAQRGRELCDQAAAEVTPDDLATILYSSGTTGEPKGAMLTQGNLASNALGMSAAFEINPHDLRLNLLPFSHIFARTCDLYTWINHGSQLALPASRETVMASFLEQRPTLFNGVPYFFERVYRQLREAGTADTPGSLAATLGGRLRFVCSGGAALPEHVADFYERQGLPILQGYGLTESSPVITASKRRAYRQGYVGRVLPGVEIALAADGEILTRGPHVMRGYWNRPAETAEALRDGWLHTGDLGEIDPEGYLKITGRKKEIIVTTAGKNIAPAAIEALLTEDPFILQCLVVGDGRSHLAALIVPNPDVLREHIIKHAIPVTSRAAALAHPAVLAVYEQVLADRLQNLSPHEQVRKFTLIDRGFTIESGELTPTLKLRRSIIAHNFADVIAKMYADA